MMLEDSVDSCFLLSMAPFWLAFVNCSLTFLFLAERSGLQGSTFLGYNQYVFQLLFLF